MLICLFPLSDLNKLLMVAHLSWATWAIRSRLLISFERPEQFAHGRSFVLSDPSKLLTVTHLIWAKWANSQPCLPHITCPLPHITCPLPYITCPLTHITWSIFQQLLYYSKSLRCPGQCGMGIKMVFENFSYDKGLSKRVQKSQNWRHVQFIPRPVFLKVCKYC